MSHHFDYICIGAGSGGIASANRAAMHGARVALIEPKALGGTCVNVGCVPKKAMWFGAHIAEAVKLSSDYGFDLTLNSFSWQRLLASRDGYIGRIHQGYERNLAKNGVTVIKGTARFVERNCVEVNGEHYFAEHILIATGGRPQLPDIPGASLGITSDDFFALKELPKRVAVVGAGYISVEMAGVLLALGSETHLLCRRERPLREFEPMLGETLTEIMVKEGLHFHPGSIPRSLEKQDDNSLLLSLENGQQLQVDCVIWAIGRQPVTDQLGLEQIGVQLLPGGYIDIDPYQNSSVPGIYAVGDITPRAQLTPVAIKAGRLLADRLFNGQHQAMLDDSLVPTVIFSHPTIASLGLTQMQAESLYGADALTIYTSEFTAMYHALTSHRQPSRIKLICAGDEQKVVGLHMIGYGSDELLQGFAVAVSMGATKADFDKTIAIHPTSAEELVTLR